MRDEPLDAPPEEADAEEADAEEDHGQEDEAPPGRIRAWFGRHRRRLATLSVGVFLAAVAVEVGTAIPRDVEVSVPMGDGHFDVREARIDYLQEGELVRSVTRSFASGAPPEFRDTVELSPGDYDVRVRLRSTSGAPRELSGRLTAPGDGVVRLALRAGPGRS